MSNSDITIVGNLTRDPELRYTAGGRAVASVGVAVNRRFQRNGEWEEQVSFFNVVMWGDLGENVTASCVKGTRVIVKGRLEQRSWETEAGEKRYTVEIVADSVGPDLRWATAQVERTERTQGGAGYDAGPDAYQPPGDPIYGDEEEPF